MTLPRGRRRARSAEEKAGRQAALIAATRRALETKAYDDITVAGIAADIGLTKASAYLYFPTKETLFLRVVEAELEVWLVRLESTLRRTKRPAQRTVPKVIARSLAAAPVLLQLLTLLHGRIEPNVTLDDIRRFKNFLAAALSRTGEILDEVLRLPDGSGTQLLLRLHALTIGLRQMANPPETVRNIMEEDQRLEAMLPDFESELAACLADWIEHWQGGSARRSR